MDIAAEVLHVGQLYHLSSNVPWLLQGISQKMSPIPYPVLPPPHAGKNGLSQKTVFPPVGHQNLRGLSWQILSATWCYIAASLETAFSQI